MQKLKLASAVVLANILALPAIAEVYSTRNFAMGGAGVASSKYDAAAGSNGALLTRFDEDDGIAWIVPAIGLEASDKDDVIDTLDDIPDLYDTLEFQIDAGDNAGALGTADSIIGKLQDVTGSPVRLNGAALIGFARPSKTLGIAFDIRTYFEAVAIADYDSDDEAIILEAIATDNSDLLDDTQSSGYTVGVAVSEAALTLAREFSLSNGNALSVSVTPKFQRVDTLIYAVTVQDYDSDDFDDNTTDDNNLNIDLGFSYAMGENWVFGLRARNLISEDYDTELIVFDNQSFQGTYEIEPSAVAGAAYSGESFTATLEADLVENNSFKNLDETQFIRAGFEYNAWNWAQIRLGYRYDMEDTREDVITAGLGFSPWDVFHFGLSGSYGNNDTYGAALDFRWTF
jgi:F plasmid transfer operon, TraF, protein